MSDLTDQLGYPLEVGDLVEEVCGQNAFISICRIDAIHPDGTVDLCHVSISEGWHEDPMLWVPAEWRKVLEFEDEVEMLRKHVFAGMTKDDVIDFFVSRFKDRVMPTGYEWPRWPDKTKARLGERFSIEQDGEMVDRRIDNITFDRMNTSLLKDLEHDWYTNSTYFQINAKRR